MAAIWKYAVGMVRRGHSVFELPPDAKKGTSLGAALTDESIIRSIFEVRATSNYGVVPGPCHIVIDCDRKPGQDGLTYLCLKAGVRRQTMLDTFYVDTPSGGTHHYYTLPADLHGKLTKGENWIGTEGTKSGIDWRSTGGYVVGPGSRTPKGEYKAANRKPAAPLPEVLADLFRSMVREKQESIARRKARNLEESDGGLVPLSEVESPLRRIDPDCPRPRWLRVVFAAGSAPVEDIGALEALCRAWSRGDFHPDSAPDFSDESFDELWESNKPDNQADPITYKSLRRYAYPPGSLLARVANGEGASRPCATDTAWMAELPTPRIPKQLRDILAECVP